MNTSRFFVSFVLFVPVAALAGIEVEGGTLSFKPLATDAQAREQPDTLRSVSRFHNEFKSTQAYLEGGQAAAHALLSVMKRRVIQGIKFQVSKRGDFAVVLSYHCDMPEVGAMFPFTCRSVALAFDQYGHVQGTVMGNFLQIEVHETLQFFILKEDTCCDGPVKSVLFNTNGQRICDLPDHRDDTWSSEYKIRCRLPTSGKPIQLNLSNL